MMFLKCFDVPHFSVFPLLQQEAGLSALADYYAGTKL
jgi:hypothetical protein